MKKNVIGVDLGGTKVEACLLDVEGNCLARRRVFSEPDKGLGHVTDTIIRLIQNVAEGQSYSAVGMGTPGTYIESEDRIYGSPHTFVYETSGFIGSLKQRLPVPVTVENDANCLAIAEFFAG